MRPHPIERLACVLLTIAGLTLPLAAQAWGPQGHALIADIAAVHLTPHARTEVSRLLAADGHDRLDEIASWPDAIRHARPATAPWHYVDIPLEASAYNAARDCPHGDCVVARISYFAHVLADRSAPQAQRIEALKFLVHFVADVQQPLHAEDHDDRGGNDVKLSYFGHRSNLHRIWDSGIVDHALDLHVGRHYAIDYAPTRAAAARLDAGITPRECNEWRRGIHGARLSAAAVRWANQAHRLARRVAYADLPAPPRRNWSATYQRKTWPVVRRQILRGGVRLAAVLNTSLAR
ncbi:S1/P1 nuclease [Salinisphaera sp. LB1]|uniref:S1/P1 nuclease n=1 Tax=Salinisphaera sp. LB1 TaxID=2183911 RepID=UPI000D707B4D|nr:S1/P1 nuclease [Salinisphaera sp. LB1]AWN17268.1 Endonuclease [Salinisphaera sp. LB1]